MIVVLVGTNPIKSNIEKKNNYNKMNRKYLPRIFFLFVVGLKAEAIKMPFQFYTINVGQRNRCEPPNQAEIIFDQSALLTRSHNNILWNRTKNECGLNNIFDSEIVEVCFYPKILHQMISKLCNMCISMFLFLCMCDLLHVFGTHYLI